MRLYLPLYYYLILVLIKYYLINVRIVPFSLPTQCVLIAQANYLKPRVGSFVAKKQNTLFGHSIRRLYQKH